MNLFEMISQAQGGNPLNALARQYGLSDDQVQNAVQAMMPAFATGLKRNVEAPQGMADFLRALSGGGHAGYLEDPGRALSGGGIADGNAILGHLFGSKDVSRAVAAQAEAATGVGESVLKQMLPAIAAMVMGGLSKQSHSGSGNILGDIMEQFTGAGGPPERRSEDGPLDRYESEQRDDNPFGQFFEQMMGAGATSGGSGARTGAEIFGEMFEPGRQMGEAYQKNMEHIFDRYLSGMEKRR